LKRLYQRNLCNLCPRFTHQKSVEGILAYQTISITWWEWHRARLEAAH
jgi:hypothetical protein